MARELAVCSLVALVLMAVAACGPTPAPTASPVPTVAVPTSGPKISATATLAPTPSPISSGQPGRLLARCVEVIDGDTIRVSVEGKTYSVRYIGIESPEIVHPSKPVEALGYEARDKNVELVGGKEVLLEADVSNTDRYGRLLRYVYVGGLLVNAEMVRLGLANAVAYPPDIRYQDTLRQMEEEAKSAGRGLWARTTPTPSAVPSPVCTPLACKQGEVYYCADVCPGGCGTECATPTSAAAPLVVPIPTAERTSAPPTVAPTAKSSKCDPAYPGVCIASPPPDLDCGDISFRRFKVLPPDPHRFDSDGDGIGCER